MSRRELLKEALLFGTVRYAPLFWSIPIPPVFQERKAKIFERFGLVDVSSNGGPKDHDLSIADSKALGAKMIISLDPDKSYLEKLAASGIGVINRPYFPDNQYDEELLISSLSKYKDLQTPTPFIVELFKEPNSSEQLIDPEEFIRGRFIPAAEEVISRGGVVLLPALDQRAEYSTKVSEEIYFERMLREVSKYIPARIPWENFAIAEHAYIFTPGGNPWPRIKRLDNIIWHELKKTVPVYITEAGLFQEEGNYYDSKTVGREIIRLLSMEIPSYLPIEAFCVWLLANKAQRPDYNGLVEDEKTRRLVDRFEHAALRGIDGETEAYKAIKAYAESNPLQVDW